MFIATFDHLFAHSPSAYMLVDRELRYVAVNQAYLDITSSQRETLLGRPLFELFPDDPNRGSASQLRDSFERVLTTGAADTIALIRYKVPRHTAEGTVITDRYWSATHSPVLDAAGRVAYILQHTQDITELHQTRVALDAAQAALGEYDELASPERTMMASAVLDRARRIQAANADLTLEGQRLRQLFEQAPGFIAVLRGEEHIFDIANHAYRELVGRSDLVNKRVVEALPEVIGQGFVDLLDEVYRTGKTYVGRRQRVSLHRLPNELDTRIVDFVYQPIVGPDATVTGIFVQGVDVSTEVAAELELHRYREQLEALVEERSAALRAALAERSAALEALHQAQKMESLGNLTGGVAHDFNNLLQVISGNLQLLERHLGESDPAVQRRLSAAVDAVARGGKLASQLLAFARRQPLAPQVLDPARLIGGMEDLLQHSLGDGIELRLTLQRDLWHTLADPSQLENALLNLAVNARDAMAGRGSLALSATNVTLDADAARRRELDPGEYVVVAVTDTGCGMPPEVAAFAFEPFFTTKSDAGTGLGLSMVYGFARQSGGHAEIETAMGAGTTLRLWLPRARQPAAAAVPAPEAARPVRGGGETILVVEDDEPVRDVAVATLRELGYRVVKAADPQAALAILQSGLRVDLLFTDVIMPGPLRSPELAAMAQRLLPEMIVLYTSGYADDALQAEPGVHLLRKPWQREELGRTVRRLLDRRERPLTSGDELP